MAGQLTPPEADLPQYLKAATAVPPPAPPSNSGANRCASLPARRTAVVETANGTTLVTVYDCRWLNGHPDRKRPTFAVEKCTSQELL